ncbi:hypothetical protein HMPREF1584_01141 [Gardnerella vaginalis JCP8481A]|nr:hypothetical protein HMPREF1584_01141 [Gardnerella vaginalis JCP8481A]EPI42829.1 hypothetical protein HMPREF1585_00675 [Gardnerella vaginalis JCP8481B]
MLLQSICCNYIAPRLKRIVHHFDNVQFSRAVCVGGHTHNIDLSMK